jgi:hypothetical protein
MDPMGGPGRNPQHQRGRSLLGSILTTAAAGLAMSKLNSSTESSKSEEEYTTDTQEQTTSTSGTEDYSMEDGYPSTCPGCGAPTNGKRFCEYCGTKVF